MGVHKTGGLADHVSRMDFSEIAKKIAASKKKTKKYRQNILFDPDLYKEFERAVGKKRIGNSLQILMRGYLDYTKGKK